MFWDFCPQVAQGLTETERLIRDVLAQGTSMTGVDASALLSLSGKKIRPGLMLLAASFGEHDRERVTHLAAALELLHMASLIHDDVIDGSDLRQGRPAVHKIIGKRSAVLLGDWIFTRCMSLVAQYADSQGMNRLSHALGVMTASELAIERSRFLPSKSLRRYLRLISGKTAGLFSLSLYLGAKEAGLCDSHLQTFRRLGYNLGLCFQIQDDILDYVSSEGVLGKTAGQDLRAGYFTLPVILCLTDGKSRLTNGFNTLKLKPWKKSACSSLSEGLKKEGWIQRSWDTLEIFKKRVFSELLKLPKTETSAYLEEFSRRMFARSF